MSKDRSNQDGKASDKGEGGLEVEVKLVGAPIDAGDILADPSVLAAKQGEPETVMLRAVYFDTPDFSLQRAKAVLRVREEGDRFLVTAKTPGGTDSFARLEVEAPAPGLEPDRALLLACLPPKLAKEIGDAELRPVFRTGIERRKLMLATPAGKVELAIDQGQLLAGERSDPVAELELELKSGDAVAVWRLAQQLGGPRGLRPSLRSKGERGYALALDTPPAGVKSEPVALPSGISLDEALERILRSAFLHLLRNQPAAEDGRDAEGLHQFRVALRRLRALLKLLRDFGPNLQLEELRAGAKALMTRLNAGRALDVFLSELFPEAGTALNGFDGLDALEGKAKAAREEAYAEARKGVADPATGRFELSLGTWIEEKGWRSGASEKALGWLGEPAAAFAARAVGESQKRVLKRGKKFRRLSPPERHKVRIAAKNLRYVTDFFSAALEGEAKGKSFFRTLEALQDELGAANDLAGIADVVRPLLTPDLSMEGHVAGGAVLGWAAARLDAKQDGLHAAWKRFKKKPLPWSGAT